MTLQELQKLIGKTCRFTAPECTVFPNFDLTGRVVSAFIANNGEPSVNVTFHGTRYTVGTNMKSLKIEILH